jgi:hypothetical protein
MRKVKDFALRYTKALAAASATAMTPVVLELIAELSTKATAGVTVLAATIAVALSPKNKEKTSE